MKTNLPVQKTKIRAAAPRIIALGGLAAALLILGPSGCKNSATGGDSVTPDNVAGSYVLMSVDAKAVPCAVSHEGHEVTVKSGAFTISADGTCRSETVFSVAGNPDVHRSVEATYTVSGTNLLMRWKGAGRTTGNLAGNVFTMNNEGMIFVYQK